MAMTRSHIRDQVSAHDHEGEAWREVVCGKAKWQPKKDAKESAGELVRQHGK